MVVEFALFVSDGDLHQERRETVLKFPIGA
jgi:hypothetical protein